IDSRMCGCPLHVANRRIVKALRWQSRPAWPSSLVHILWGFSMFSKGFSAILCHGPVPRQLAEKPLRSSLDENHILQLPPFQILNWWSRNVQTRNARLERRSACLTEAGVLGPRRGADGTGTSCHAVRQPATACRTAARWRTRLRSVVEKTEA